VSVRIVSWNIQKGIGVDLQRNLPRTARVLSELAPDVVGLQEVLRTDRCDQAAALADALGLQMAWGPARAVAGGTYGNALLVRGRVVETRVHDLSVPGREPRACLEVLLETQAESLMLRVFVCHLGLRTRERAAQIERLSEVLRATESGGSGVPRIVLGDFNEWHGTTVTRALATEMRGAPTPLPTHPSPWPLFALDRIAWDAQLRGRVRVANVGRASDHRALEATLSA
jgi:endonuclease/exonuclease/phosphatase family metal-dependent hydrolase